MADTNHVYYGSGAPPIIYHQGKAYIGGMVEHIDTNGFTLELGSPTTNKLCNALGIIESYSGGDMS